MANRQRKGQAAAAAALLAIIAALIVLYILFLPPEDRNVILGTDNQTGSVSGTRARSAEQNVTLVKESPGRIDFLSQKMIEHAIPSTQIYTRTAGAVLEKKDSLYVKRTVFSSVETDMEFNVADLANTENLLLGFNIASKKGRLVITLNDEEIFNKQIVSANTEPISLPKKLLKAENRLHFSVSSPGILFWRTNEYSLETIQVTGDITRTDAQRSRNIFITTPVEFNNLEKARVRFSADCDLDFAGPLDVWVNQFNIYSSVPDCGVGRLGLEFPRSYLKVGENELLFSIERGDYYLSHVVVESELKQVDFPVYFFDVSEDQYRSVRNGSKSIIAHIEFIDSMDRKEGEFIVNGHVIGFDTKEVSLEEDISVDVVRGNNGVKIKPERTLDVREIDVRLVDKE